MGIKTTSNIVIKSSQKANNPALIVNSGIAATPIIVEPDKKTKNLGFRGLFPAKNTQGLYDSFISIKDTVKTDNQFLTRVVNNVNRIIKTTGKTNSNYWPAASVSESFFHSNDGTYRIALDKTVRESKLSGVGEHISITISIQKMDNRKSNPWKSVGGCELSYNDSPTKINFFLPEIEDPIAKKTLYATLMELYNS